MTDISSQVSQPGPTHARRDGDARLVLFALHPRSYSEAICEAVADLRPRLSVKAVHPDDIEYETESRVPVLVVCCHPKPKGLGVAARWVQFRPYEDPDAVRIDGVRRSFPVLGLAELLELIDHLCKDLAGVRV